MNKHAMQRRLMLAYVALDKAQTIADPVGDTLSEVIDPNEPTNEVVRSLLREVLNQVEDETTQANRLVGSTN